MKGVFFKKQSIDCLFHDQRRRHLHQSSLLVYESQGPQGDISAEQHFASHLLAILHFLVITIYVTSWLVCNH